MAGGARKPPSGFAPQTMARLPGLSEALSSPNCEFVRLGRSLEEFSVYSTGNAASGASP